MGTHANVGFSKFPKQGPLVGKRVIVCFDYHTENQMGAVCVRDDYEEPYRTLFRLDDGRYVEATECQYR